MRNEFRFYAPRRKHSFDYVGKRARERDGRGEAARFSVGNLYFLLILLPPVDPVIGLYARIQIGSLPAKILPPIAFKSHTNARLKNIGRINDVAVR